MRIFKHTLVALVVVAGCTLDRPTINDPALTPPADVLAAKGGPKATLPNANLVWSETVNVAAPQEVPNWQPTLLTGDGRDKFGQVSSVSEYQGNFCGVVATVENGLNVDPNTYYSSTMAAACGPARVYRFYTGAGGRESAPLEFGPHHVVIDIGTIPVGSSANRSTLYGVQQPNCQRFVFDDIYPPANHIRVTRLPDVASANGLPARQWRVESQGSHRAMCIVLGKGGKVINTGVSYYLPFAYTVTDMPGPSSTYP